MCTGTQILSLFQQLWIELTELGNGIEMLSETMPVKFNIKNMTTTQKTHIGTCFMGLTIVDLRSITGFLWFPPVVTLDSWGVALTGPPGRATLVADRVIQYKWRHFTLYLYNLVCGMNIIHWEEKRKGHKDDSPIIFQTKL